MGVYGIHLNIISIRKRIGDTIVVSDVTCTRQSVNTRVVIRFFMTRKYPLNNIDVMYDKITI